MPETDWTAIPYWMEGAADVAETTYTPFHHEPDAGPVRLIVRRVKPTPGPQPVLFVNYSYHAFITDRDGDTLDLEAGHRRRAEIENAIRDPASNAGQALKYGMGLNRLPSGRLLSNAARLGAQSLPRTRYGVMSHNLAARTPRLAQGDARRPTRPCDAASLPRQGASPARHATSPASPSGLACNGGERKCTARRPGLLIWALKIAPRAATTGRNTPPRRTNPASSFSSASGLDQHIP